MTSENVNGMNCEFIMDKSRANKSDAVIYDGINMSEKLEFSRFLSSMKQPLCITLLDLVVQEKILNWTMTYDKKNSDINLPYGKIRKLTDNVKLDYEAIAREKAIITIHKLKRKVVRRVYMYLI